MNTLSPGQASVIGAVHPALGKQLQSEYAHDFGEDTFRFLLAGAHIEMAILSAIAVVMEVVRRSSALLVIISFMFRLHC